MSAIQIDKLGNCGRKLWKTGSCGNYQALRFNSAKNKSQKLAFGSTEAREKYYKSKLKGNKKYSGFQRYSICATPALKNGRKCGGANNKTRRGQ
jgi:hypothetical protein